MCTDSIRGLLLTESTEGHASQQDIIRHPLEYIQVWQIRYNVPYQGVGVVGKAKKKGNKVWNRRQIGAKD